jgi:glutamate dehydrogenase
MVHVHEDWMARLEDQGLLDREIEFLPSSEAMEARRTSHKGLTAPELATLLAYTKIVLAPEVLASDLPDEEYLADRLVGYFPSRLRERYADQMTEHRLRREIVSTVVVNRFVNAAGVSCFHRLSGETGAGAPDVIRAHIAARAIFAADDLDTRIRALDHQVDAAAQTGLRIEVRTLVERATRWLLDNRPRPVDIGAAVNQFAGGVQAVQAALPTLLTGRDAEALASRLKSYRAAHVPEDLAVAVAALNPAYAALTIVQTAEREGVDLGKVAEVHFALGQRLGLDRLLTRIIELPRDDRWQTMARAALRDDLHTVHAGLTAQVLAADGAEARTPRELVSGWEKANPVVPETVRLLRSVTGSRTDLARASVGLRRVRALLPS